MLLNWKRLVECDTHTNLLSVYDANIHLVFKDSHALHYNLKTVKWWVMDSKCYFGLFFPQKQKEKKKRKNFH